MRRLEARLRRKGGLDAGLIERGGPRDDRRRSPSSFVLALAAIYVGTIEAAFSALMRLSLRLTAERNGRAGGLGPYLDDPVLLFVPGPPAHGADRHGGHRVLGQPARRRARAGPRDDRALDGGLRHRVRAPAAAADRAERPRARARFPAAVVRPDRAAAAADHACAGRPHRDAAARARVRGGAGRRGGRGR